MSETGFDLNAWKKQAEGELERLVIKEANLDTELSDIREQIGNLNEALGIKPKNGATRRRFRNQVIDYVTTQKLGSIDVESLIHACFDGDESLTEPLTLSLKRLAKDSKGEFSFDGNVLSVIASDDEV